MSRTYTRKAEEDKVNPHSRTTVIWPPDPYEDVYAGALCPGLRMEDVTVALCNTCPVMDRCAALFEDLQFGTLAKSGVKLDSHLEGVWGGDEYVIDPKSKQTYRNGVRWYVKDRPTRKDWA